MKKIAVVLGAAAVATFTGCRDLEYDARHGKLVQNEPTTIETEPAKTVETTPAPTREIKIEEPKCHCLPGTKHTAPCTCGASDCKCVVEKPQPPKPTMPEYTTYVVQNGDYLAKISKKFNITIGSIKRLNNMKDDKIRVGQKIKIPGKVDVGVQAAPATAESKVATKTAKKNGAAPYTGATKEYVVKNGDTLGSVAYGNGLNIRQLKQLNGLTSDAIKVGQKLKIPAEKVLKPAAKAAPAKPAVKPALAKPEAAKPTEPTVPGVLPTATPAQKTEPAAETASAASVESVPVTVPAAPATTTYQVQEGEDLTRISVEFGVSVSAIRELNGLGENDTIKPGQVLKLPAESQQ